MRLPTGITKLFSVAEWQERQHNSGMPSRAKYLTGLVAAPHTPMHADGSLNLSAIPKQAEVLARNGVSGAFICGSTGECHSLSTPERMQTAEAWQRAVAGGPVKLIIHVGHNSIEEAKGLAAHAARIGADATAAMAPSYFKPASVSDLVDFCAPVAKQAPNLPFYFYDIPSMTGVSLSMADFLETGGPRMPNLAGLKFTSLNLMSLQQCLAVENGRFNILFGSDEILLAALALGVHGAVGSTYNYAAPIYNDLLKAFAAGDLVKARNLQLRSVRLVEVLCQFGVLAAGKALMKQVGVDCGPVRPPVRALTELEMDRLREAVAALDVLGRPV